MSKKEPENQSAAQEISVESQDGASSTKMNSVHELLKLNVKDHTEKKNGLSYLSWAWAWTEALKADSAANFEVKMFDGGESPYMVINGTGMVWVTVTMFGKPMTCFLPIMDHRNKPIQQPDAFQVNTSLMRCMTKALALHGIGLYIYAGEDLPEQDEVKPEAKVPVKTVEAKVRDDQDDANIALFGQSMIDFVDICKSTNDLMSYWKANQEKIERLQANNAAMYEKVVSVFKTARAKLKETENE